MEQSLNILISTLVALFAVWLSAYIVGRILFRGENYLRSRRFKKILKNEAIKDLKVESFNTLGIPVTVSFSDPNDKKRRIVSMV